MAESSAGFHPTAWLLWWLAAVVAALLTQNPLYLAILLLVAAWVIISLRRPEEDQFARPGIDLVLRLGPPLLLLTALFNALTIHVGATVLFRLPGHLPVVGGPVTVEAFVYGLMTGLNLVTLLAIFAAFSLGADYRKLLRMVPGFVFQAGVVTSIALAFVPQTLAALKEIREAQLIRGHRFRGWRDLPPLFLPLLTSGLEHSIQLAEAMESRGFGGPRPQPARRPVWSQLAVAVGLVASLVGLGLWSLMARPGPGLALLVGGVAGAIWGLQRGSTARLARRSRYRPPRWQRRDLFLAATSVVVLALLLAVRVTAAAVLSFYPYPRLIWPPFHPLVGVLLLWLALPALLQRWPADQAQPVAEDQGEARPATSEAQQ